MVNAGEYSDTLRALGRFFEMVAAKNVQLADRGALLEVSWQKSSGGREERRFQNLEVEALRSTARLFRGLEGGTPQLTIAEQLRTIGRMLDEEGADGEVTIAELDDRFVVSCVARGEPRSWECLRSEVVDRAAQFHAERLRAQTVR
jgi:hypothetical protein